MFPLRSTLRHLLPATMVLVLALQACVLPTTSSSVKYPIIVLPGVMASRLSQFDGNGFRCVRSQ